MLSYQTITPHIHWRNSTELEIPKLKNHFISGLSSLHNNLPIDLGFRLLTHYRIIFNLLQTNLLNTKLSENFYLHGRFGFNANPFAINTTKMIILNNIKTLLAIPHKKLKAGT